MSAIDIHDDIATEDTGPALPPEAPSLPPGEWIRKNLFSSVGNSILTIFTSLFLFWAARALLNFALNNADRNWIAPATNLRLMMTQAYPESQYVRIWVTVGMVMVLTGLSMAYWRAGGAISARRIATWFATTGLLAAFAALVTHAPLERFKGGEQDGEVVYGNCLTGETLEDEFEACRLTHMEGLSGRLWVFILAAVLLAIAGAIWFGLGDRRRSTFFALPKVIYVGLGALVASLWVVPYGHYAFRTNADGDAEFIAESGRLVAETTRTPWTVMWVLLGAAYILGLVLRDRLPSLKLVLGLTWLLLPFIAIWVILRDPAFDMDRVLNIDIPMFLAFALIGGAILYALTAPKLGEIGRIIAFGFLLLAIFHWVAAFFGWYPMLQKARISFLVFALFAMAAANFAGDRRTRLMYMSVWIGTMAVVHYFATAINSPSTLEGIQADTFLGGFLVTIVISWLTMLFSFPLGVILALGRTSSLPIFRVICTGFIEMVRGVPLITVLFFFSIILPLFLPDGMDLTELAAIMIGLSLFSAAYLAENIRGGLQSIRRGQHEAADAMGLTPAQRTSLIVLPQALRVSIPPLVGQTIATYKETSLVAIVGVFDLLYMANKVIPNQTQFLGKRLEGFMIVCVIYWIGSFAMSRYSLSLERRLGVGER